MLFGCKHANSAARSQPRESVGIMILHGILAVGTPHFSTIALRKIQTCVDHFPTSCMEHCRGPLRAGAFAICAWSLLPDLLTNCSAFLVHIGDTFARCKYLLTTPRACRSTRVVEANRDVPLMHIGDIFVQRNALTVCLYWQLTCGVGYPPSRRKRNVGCVQDGAGEKDGPDVHGSFPPGAPEPQRLVH